MAQLLVRNISEALAKTLKQRAAEHGVSAEEEHRRILQEALAPAAGESDEKRTLFDHIRMLGEIAPDFEFERERRNWARREVEF
ncbi:MAG: DNA-binding protein [Armatimonadetes bacterium]|nr:DNA-binding protein [Akkermansiaceae bacterium]